MKNLIRSVLAFVLLTAATASFAWFWDNDSWDCPPWAYNCNPYDEWDPRYWMEEMEQEWDDDDDYYRYGGPYGYGGYPGYGYGGYPGYGYGGYPGYGGGYPGYGGGYGGYPGYGYGPYGY